MKYFISTKLKNGKLKISIVLFALSIILFLMSKFISGFANFYHDNIYLVLVNVIARAFSIVPFSIYELIIYIFFGYIIFRIMRYIYLIHIKKATFRKCINKAEINVSFYLSIFIFLNMTNQGVNSFRDSFAYITKLNTCDISQEKLADICVDFKDKLNELDKKIQRDKNGLLVLNYDVDTAGVKFMSDLGNKFDCLKGYYPKPKHFILSKVMSYELLQGETTFTMEANYNNDMLKYNVPFTICHELSHIRGFNNEDEANYIGFLGCINSDRDEFQYSGYLTAYIYCMNNLYYLDKDKYKEIQDDLSDNVKNEVKSDIAYWSSYKGSLSNIYDKIYGVILRMGGQKGGMASYSRVVRLIIAGYKVQWDI